MNPGYAFLLIQPLFLLAFLLACWRWSPARRASERNAAKLLAANPDADQLAELLPLQSNWNSGKQCEIDGRIHEMQNNGWTYLRTSEVSPLISLKYWGGAVQLLFIRMTPSVVDDGGKR